jgi:hypothetical protein
MEECVGFMPQKALSAQYMGHWMGLKASLNAVQESNPSSSNT